MIVKRNVAHCCPKSPYIAVRCFGIASESDSEKTHLQSNLPGICSTTRHKITCSVNYIDFANPGFIQCMELE